MKKKLRSQLKLNAIRLGLGGGPILLIAGAQKAGTTGLYQTLAQHPQMLVGKRKEIHYFDDERIPFGDHKFYEQAFPLAFKHKGRLAFESSPSYLFHPLVAERVKAYRPEMKIIILVREPVARAYSAWNMYHNKFQNSDDFHPKSLVDKRGFEEAVNWEMDNIDKLVAWGDDKYAYLRRGLYVEQLDRWYGLFPSAQILTIDQQELLTEQDEAMIKIADFLGISASFELPQVKGNVSNYAGSIHPATQARLSRFFAPHNASLLAKYGLGKAW